MKIRVLEVAGSPYEMGLAHGRAFAADIARFSEERVRLAGQGSWGGNELTRAEVLALAEACVPAHRSYAPELVEELEGVAAGCGLSLAELIIVGGFTDFVDAVYAGAGRAVAAPVAADNCTAFLVANERTPDGHGFVGQTWDMHHSATEQIVMLRGTPADAPEFFAYTTVGCVGMIGMNEAGIAVGINNLSAGDGRVGVTWPFAVRRILQQQTLESALEELRRAPLSGAHNYLLMDAEGRGVNVEAMPTRRAETELGSDVLVHTNHCLLADTEAVQRPRDPDSTSDLRLARGRELLAEGPVTPERLQELTRDPEAICYAAQAPRFVETCGAAIMRPATREFWAVWGLPSENAYERFSLSA